MLAQDWIRKAREQGWNFESASGLTLRLTCSKVGCEGHLDRSMLDLGPVPEPCALGHTGPYSRRVYSNYEGLVDQLRQRRRQLGLDQSEVDEITGLGDGHIAKLESFAKTAGPPTLMLWAQALGLQIVMEPCALPRATERAIERRTQPYDQHKRVRFKHGSAAALPPREK